jgi:hypothetical protein
MFHDPWGNKNGNRYGSPIRYQYMVSCSSIIDKGVDVREYIGHIDKPSRSESTGIRHVRHGKRSIERLRR